MLGKHLGFSKAISMLSALTVIGHKGEARYNSSPQCFRIRFRTYFLFQSDSRLLFFFLLQLQPSIFFTHLTPTHDFTSAPILLWEPSFVFMFYGQRKIRTKRDSEWKKYVLLKYLLEQYLLFSFYWFYISNPATHSWHLRFLTPSSDSGIWFILTPSLVFNIFDSRLRHKPRIPACFFNKNYP